MAEEPEDQFTGKLKDLLEKLPSAQLTNRERQVLALLLVGRTAKEVAQMLGMSHRTCEVHRRNIVAKFGVRNLTELASSGLVDRKDLTPPKIPSPALLALANQLKQMQKTVDRLIAEQRTS